MPLDPSFWDPDPVDAWIDGMALDLNLVGPEGRAYLENYLKDMDKEGLTPSPDAVGLLNEIRRELARRAPFKVGARVRILPPHGPPNAIGVITELKPEKGGALVKLDDDGQEHGWGWKEMEPIDDGGLLPNGRLPVYPTIIEMMNQSIKDMNRAEDARFLTTLPLVEAR